MTLARSWASHALSNRRFHRQLHRASHNRYLNQMLDSMRRTMALLSATTMMSETRRTESLSEHERIVSAISARDETAAQAAAEEHISNAYRTRLMIESGG